MISRIISQFTSNRQWLHTSWPVGTADLCDSSCSWFRGSHCAWWCFRRSHSAWRLNFRPELCCSSNSSSRHALWQNNDSKVHDLTFRDLQWKHVNTKPIENMSRPPMTKPLTDIATLTRVKAKLCYRLYSKFHATPITQLQNITCHIGLRSVSCHVTG